MHPDDKRKAAALVVAFFPVAAWLAAVRAEDDGASRGFRALGAR